MDIFVLTLAIIIPIPFCLFRRKRYGIGWRQLLLVYASISLVGAIGACVGSFLAGGSIKGIRLYGLMLFDAMFLPLVAKLIRSEVGQLGDFVAVPVAMSCAASKINCAIEGCCKGLVLYHDQSQQAVRFPSQIFELSLWVLLAAYLLVLETRKKSENLLWPIFMVWFGLLRYAVDFLRGSALEKLPFFFTMPGGRFWSLIVFILGLLWLFFALKDKLDRKPKLIEIVRSLFGLEIST